MERSGVSSHLGYTCLYTREKCPRSNHHKFMEVSKFQSRDVFETLDTARFLRPISLWSHSAVVQYLFLIFPINVKIQNFSFNQLHVHEDIGVQLDF